MALFLAVFLYTVKTKNRVSNQLFALFLVLKAIDISGFFEGFILQSPSDLSMIRNLFVFLQLPVFYMYILSVCYSDFKQKRKYVVHLIPFLIANVVLIPRYYLVDTESKIKLLTNHKNIAEFRFNHIFLHLQVAFYLILVFVVLRRAKKIYQENYTSANVKSYDWLFQLSTAVTVFYTIALVKNVLKFSQFDFASEWFRVSLLLFEMLIICWYLFKALNYPDLFRNIDSRLKLVNDIISEEKKSKKIGIANTDENLIALKKYMSSEKPFLDPSLSIKDVSESLKTPVRDVSLLINHQLDQHFFDFINSYRIEEAMDLLKDPLKKSVTVLEILYEVGFNSKSSFNTAFKKYTGMTPSAFRKKHISGN
ncbi:AraC family transcriptional regulator [Aquimarina sp. RZ0]|uniref:helix-turn-helix domain-containing protein n=1 Tax=Aquimarina sp. RZ0 TaxID=2607730 RepID=UPI0021039FD9|nr:helix-turn-helix domain-containing protein [Aquimarina sp. RZ0]